MSLRRRALASILAASITFVGTGQTAQAAMVGTEQLAGASNTTAPAAQGDAQARLADLLQRDDVVRALTERGVSVDAARERVAALTDGEAAWMAQQIDTAPAGADVLGTIVFLFVLLLVTDILGFTKIFPFTRSIR